jgi:cytoskeletal protein CcmA (bactofilin family)
MADKSPSDDLTDRSFIGRTIKIHGSLKGREDLIYLGEFDGQLNLNGFHLMVGDSANMKADVNARVVTIEGTISGKIEPSELATIQATGVVTGEIWSPRLTTEEGAKFSGRCAVGLPPEGESPSIPDFNELYRMVEKELKGLTDAQLDFSTDSPNWAQWSIRRQVSHMSNSVFLWLVGRWREILWVNREPEPELVKISEGEHGHDRMLDPEEYRDIKTLLKMLRRSHDLILEIVSRETAQSIRDKQLVLTLPPDARLGTSEESAHDLWLKFKEAHTDGISQDPDDPRTWIITLEAKIRHLYYEHLAHARTIQRLKELQGLNSKVTLTRVGYLTFEEFWSA